MQWLRISSRLSSIPVCNLAMLTTDKYAADPEKFAKTGTLSNGRRGAVGQASRPVFAQVLLNRPGGLWDERSARETS